MRIAGHLHAQGFSTPGIIAAAPEDGLLLIEDLGDDTYTRLLARGEAEEPLYRLAVDTLIALHRLPQDVAVPPSVPAYGMERMLEEVNRVHVWYLPLIGAAPLPVAAVADYEATWRALLPTAWCVPTSLVLFDYHVDNLLGLFDRAGIKACGLLDFQDAVAGPVTYDLMSLLEDARRDLDSALVGAMKARYRAAFPGIEADTFATSWAIMAAQRHMRVIGTFARLKLRDGKPQYLKLMPRLWRYMESCLAHPHLAPLKAWLDRHVPPEQRALPAALLATAS